MMNKFQKKAFECEIIGEMYDYLENRSHHYQHWDSEKCEYVDHDTNDSNYAFEIERLAIIRNIMTRVEKMI